MNSRRQDWKPEDLLRPLLTQAEKDRIKSIRKARLENPPSSPDEVGFLLDLINRLSRLRPDEFDFPQVIAFANVVEKWAFLMRFLKRVRMEARHEWESPPNRQEVYRGNAECSVSNAFYLVRPYFRIVKGASLDLVDRLRKATLTLSVDGINVLERGPLEDHLIDQQGRPYWRSPWRFPQCPKYRFQRAKLSEDGQEAYCDGSMGLMAINQALIHAFVEGVPPGLGSCVIDFGLVMGLYTTNDVRGQPRLKPDNTARVGGASLP